MDDFRLDAVKFPFPGFVARFTNTMIDYLEDHPGPGPSAEGESPAIWKGAYRTIYADQDVMVFERRHATESVVVAVKRGEAATIDLPRAVHLDPGVYPGPLTGTSAANANNRLAVGPGGKATIFLESLGALVVWSRQSPQ